MPLSYYDAQDVVYNALRADSTLYNMLASGQGSIYIAGKMTPKDMDESENVRRLAATPAKALAVTVEWAGEKELSGSTHLSEQSVIIRIHDRPIGTAYNIKRVRERIKTVIYSLTTHPSTASKGFLNINMISTTGIDYDIMLATAYEALLFKFMVSNHSADGRI